MFDLRPSKAISSSRHVTSVVFPHPCGALMPNCTSQLVRSSFNSTAQAMKRPWRMMRSIATLTLSNHQKPPRGASCTPLCQNRTFIVHHVCPLVYLSDVLALFACDRPRADLLLIDSASGKTPKHGAMPRPPPRKAPKFALDRS